MIGIVLSESPGLVSSWPSGPHSRRRGADRRGADWTTAAGAPTLVAIVGGAPGVPRRVPAPGSRRFHARRHRVPCDLRRLRRSRPRRRAVAAAEQAAQTTSPPQARSRLEAAADAVSGEGAAECRKAVSPEVLKALAPAPGDTRWPAWTSTSRGFGEMPGYQPSAQYLNADSPDDSVIVVRGTVHGAGVLRQTARCLWPCSTSGSGT